MGITRFRTNQLFGGREPFGTPTTTEILLQCFKTERPLLNMEEDLNMWSLTEFTSLNWVRCWKYYHSLSLHRDHTSPSQRPRDCGRTRHHPESPQFSLRAKSCFCGLWSFVCHMTFRKAARESHPNLACSFIFYLSNHGDRFSACVSFEKLGMHVCLSPSPPLGILKAAGMGL